MGLYWTVTRYGRSRRPFSLSVLLVECVFVSGGTVENDGHHHRRPEMLNSLNRERWSSFFFFPFSMAQLFFSSSSLPNRKSNESRGVKLKRNKMVARYIGYPVLLLLLLKEGRKKKKKEEKRVWSIRPPPASQPPDSSRHINMRPGNIGPR